MKNEKNALWKRTLASVVSTGMVLVQVPAVGASQSVFGTLKTSGSAWVSADSAEWSQVAATRPLLAGDSVKTDDKGFAVAEMGPQGTIGLAPGAQVRTSGTASAAVVGVEKGKVAFHLNDKSPMQLAAAGVTVQGRGAADGYVEVGSNGSTLTVERGTMQVATATGQRTVKAGQSLNLQVAGAYGEPEQPEEVPAAPPAPAEAPAEEESNNKYLAAWILGGTALAAIVGVVIAEAVSGDGDNNGSPNNQD